MTVTSATLRKLAALNLSPDQMAGVLELLADQQEADEARMAADASRSRRYRERGGGNISDDLRAAVMLRDKGCCQDCGSFDYPQIDHVHPVSKGGETSLDNLQVLCRVCNARKKDRVRKQISKEIPRNIHGESEDQNTPDKEKSPTPPKENNPKNSPPSGVRTTPAKATPRSELLAVLDAERAQDLIDHRNRIKKPMTAKAARQLAAKLARCPDPNAAADLMIEKGWQSIEPEWIGNAAQPRASPSKPMSKGDAMRSLMNGGNHDEPRNDQHRTTIDGDIRQLSFAQR